MWRSQPVSGCLGCEEEEAEGDEPALAAALRCCLLVQPPRGMPASSAQPRPAMPGMPGMSPAIGAMQHMTHQVRCSSSPRMPPMHLEVLCKPQSLAKPIDCAGMNAALPLLRCSNKACSLRGVTQ